MAFYMKYSPLSQVGGKSPLNVSKSKGNSNEIKRKMLFLKVLRFT